MLVSVSSIIMLTLVAGVDRVAVMVAVAVTVSVSLSFSMTMGPLWFFSFLDIPVIFITVIVILRRVVVLMRVVRMCMSPS